MKRLGFLGSSYANVRAAAVALAGATAVTFSTRASFAGCGDGACGRVDWSEVTASNQGTAVAAKLHGAFAWEASPDGWQTHPIGGTLSGYVWLSCVPPGDSGPVETTCTDKLASEIAKAGTNTPLTWAGVNNFDLTTHQPIVPRGLYAEGQPGAASYLIAFPLGGQPINQSVCPTALAFGKDAGAPDSGATPGTGGAASPDGSVSGTGSTHGSTSGGGPVGHDSGTSGAGGTTGAGGTSTSAGGAKAAGGAPRSSMNGTGGPSDETGGTATTNGAADAGGGCHVSAVAPTSGRSTMWLAALAIGFAFVRRSRSARLRSL